MSLRNAYRLLQHGAEALTFVEEAGICIDLEYCRAKLAVVEDRLRQAEAQLRASPLGRAWVKRYGAKLKLNSVLQLRHVLYVDMRAKPFKQSEGGADSVSEESLRQTRVDGITYVLQLRRLKKAKDVLTSLIRYTVEGKIHPSFLLHTVATYRSSSADPNLQNVPVRDKVIMDICRRAFVPRPGHVLMEIDFSGIEVGIAATYHQDPVMLRYLQDPTSDMHADMARDIFLLPKFNAPLKSLEGGYTIRQAAKNGFVFPQFYGDFYESCAFNVGCSWSKLPHRGRWTADDGVVFDGRPIGVYLLARKIDCFEAFVEHMRRVESNFWGRRFRVYAEWRKAWYAKYQRSGGFEMKTGFRVSGVLQRNQVINYPVQGSAFHCLLWSLIQMVARLHGWRSKVIGEIHDSMLLDVHPDEFSDVVALARQICTVDLPKAWDWITVPMRIEAAASEVDGNWSQMHAVEV